MRLSRVLVFTGLLAIVCLLFAACGGSGGGSKMPMTPLAITTTSPLPQGSINNPYTAALNATGGSGNYTWTITSGSLPTGLMFDGAHGLISGVPTVFGRFSFTVQVSDGTSTVSAMLTLPIGGALLLECNSCAMGTTQLPVGTVGSPYSAMFSATGGTTPYTWCVVESGGACDNGAGGGLPAGLTITTDSNNNGIISGTPTSQPAAPLSVIVEARDSETPVASGTITVTLTIFSISPTMLPNGMTYIPYSQNLTALGGLGPYTWCVMEANGSCDNGTGGALPAGLSLSSCTRSQRPTCAISGTPTQTGTSMFTAMVTDGQTPPATATQSISLTITAGVTNSLLTGNFAIAFTGYNNGTPFILAGSINADGMGNVVSGKIDHNDGFGSEINNPGQCGGNPNCPIPETIQTGSTYDLSAGNGLGTMTLNTLDNNNNPHTYQFSIAVSAKACTPGQPSLSACGRLIQRDSNNPHTYGSGVLKIQDSAYFSLGAFFPGNFAVLVNGFDPNQHRYAAAGAIGTNPTTQIDVDCNGNGWHLSGCPLNQNDNGSLAYNPFPGSQFSANIDPNTGRGTFVNLRFPNDPNGYCTGGVGGVNCGYAYYIVNRQEVILISSDPYSKPANLTLWSAYRQKSFATGWTLEQLSGKIILELTGDNGGNPDVTAGILNADGMGGASFSGDENNGGTLSQPSSSGTYALTSNGNSTGGFSLSGFSQPALSGATVYLYSGDLGYFVGADSNVTSGVIEQQTGSPFSNASVAGALEGGTAWPAASVVTNSVAEMFADGAGNITATQYTSGPGGPGGPNQLTLTYSVDSTGRTVVNQSGNEFGVLYVIGPKKFLLLPAGNSPALSIFINGQAD